MVTPIYDNEIPSNFIGLIISLISRRLVNITKFNDVPQNSLYKTTIWNQLSLPPLALGLTFFYFKTA